MKYYSKSCRMTEIVLADLVGGRFGQEPFLPSEQRLAEYYQASRHTIRRIIEKLLFDGMLIRNANRRLQINPDQLERVRAGIRSSGPVSLAFAYAAYPDSLISDVTAGLRQYATEHEIKLQIITSPSGHEPMIRSLENVSAFGINGIFILPYFMNEYVNVINRLIASDVAVLTLSALPGADCGSICSDDFSGAFMAVSRLIAKYDRPVYFWGARDETSTTQSIYNAWCQAMMEAGFDQEIPFYRSSYDACGTNPELWSMENKIEHPTLLARNFLKKLKFPVSIFAINDYVAQGIYRAAEKLKLRIGSDIMISGFGDLPMASRLNPPLTSVRSSRTQIGYRAAQTLHQMITGELTTPVHLRIPMELVERASS